MDFAQTLGTFTAAVEAGDGAGLASLFAADGTYVDRFYGSFQGRPAIVEMLENHFHAHGRDFLWEMRHPVFDGRIGYVEYAFSYTSTLPGAEGRRVFFDGIARFEVEDGLIVEYREVFDTGVALAQLGFDDGRMAAILRKGAERLRATVSETPHLKRDR